ncbi:hypothetical protein GIW70_09400 [Pseudomonas syringae]|nr:hypothetical protein [Pseudomonas syringae]MCF5068411.1 hypothetical protein [Pseudomonas syringae]
MPPRVSPALSHYWITAAVRLPQADAQGFRTYKGRLFADVADGNVVQLAVDSQSSLYRAKLASELQPSGPILEYDAATRLWYPVEDSPSAVQRSALQSEDVYELAMESLPSTSHPVDEVFHLASESMAFKPYNAEESAHMREQRFFTFRHSQVNTYNRANNGMYPLRDPSGKPIRIRKLQTRFTLSSGEQYTSDQIKPYIKFEGYEQVARLYEEKMQIRTFTEADVKVPGENALVGQLMVVANRRIAKGEILGVYGGVVMPAKLIGSKDQTFVMKAGIHHSYGDGELIPNPMAVVGDNIISRINTHFDYDDAGKPIRQSAEGYNTVVVAFLVEADRVLGGSTVRKNYWLNTVFALEDIPAGTELRFDYGYAEDDVRQLLS